MVTSTTMDQTTAQNQQVQVRFIAQQEQYVVTDAPMLVPVHLKRYGLSEIVNHLLGTADTPTPFAFFIQNEHLQGSLADYLQEHGLSTEHIIDLHYTPTAKPPREVSTQSHDDWVAAIDITKSHFLSGSYDGIVRVFNHSNELVQQLTGHEGPVTAIHTVQSNNDTMIYSGSHDQTILGWTSNGQTTFKGVGHEGTITSLASNASGNVLYSASWDGTIKAWRCLADADNDNDDQSVSISNKRRKGNLPVKTPFTSFLGHTGPVTTLAVPNNATNEVIYSAGWDHTLRIWDITSTVCTQQINCGKSVNDIDFSSLARLLATSHSDGLVRVWDPRTSETTTAKLNLTTKQGWISSLSWSDSSPFLLACAAYDATIKIMDIRSQVPLYSIKEGVNASGEPAKILACQWRHGWLVSGGEDSKLHIRSCTE
ncbi:WD40-repeat-containing domain protein [Syncephalis plumigaleata]|nr:WD40-repeat-containing domain protein [Syncephalis plumigaleata]